MANDFTVLCAALPSSSQSTIGCRIKGVRWSPEAPKASASEGQPAKIIGELRDDDTALTQIEGGVFFVHFRQITVALR